MLSCFEYERIEDGVRILGIKAEIEDVVIPEGVVEIGERAFYSAEIETVHFPNSLMRIGESAFESCDFLRRIHFPKSCRLRKIGKRAFFGTIITELKLPREIAEIAEEAFLDCEYLEEVKLHKTAITAIADRAFYGCASLYSVDMGGVVSIGDDAFSGCSSLKSLELPATVQKLGIGCFDPKHLKALAVSHITPERLCELLANDAELMSAVASGDIEIIFDE